MDIEFSCQKCHQKMVIDPSGAGMTIECSNCKEPVIVPDVKPTVVDNRNAGQDKQTKVCPFCGEDVLMVAKKCKHCGETIDVVLRTAEEAVRASSKQQNINVNQNVQTPAPLIVQQKQNFPHGWHLLGTILTLGWWSIIWILHYIFRDRNRYW